MNVAMRPVKNLLQWWQVYCLYRCSFPISERKPFSIIVKMTRRGKTDTWALYRNGRFAGFATTINGSREILLDYLAISPKYRGQGTGRATLAAMMAQYAGKGLFVEIESAFEPGAEQSERLRRRQFYLSCGMVPFEVMAMVFGVKMELLGCGCRLSFAEYQNFYRTHYNPWAAQHLSEEPYTKK